MNSSSLLQEADRCVKCGICLPNCPTYLLESDENRSPRGRISLIQGVLEGGLKVDSALIQHLASCLHCLNCQTACPSGVNYAALIDGAMGYISGRRSLLARMLAFLARHPWLGRLISVFQRSPLFSMSMQFSRGKVKRMLGLLSLKQTVFRQAREVVSQPQSTNALFLGCLSELNDRNIIADFLAICDQLSIPIAVPHGQGCCGAIDQHKGNLNAAQQLMDANQQAFHGMKKVVVLSSGCGAQLASSANILAVDAVSFLLAQPWLEKVTLKPLPQRVAIHTPCSLRNSLKAAEAVPRLLSRIPGLELHMLESGYGCCGGAGHHLLDDIETADRLLEPLLDEIVHAQATFVVTSNSGCSMHIRSGLASRGHLIEILHPVELLCRQWD